MEDALRLTGTHQLRMKLLRRLTNSWFQQEGEAWLGNLVQVGVVSLLEVSRVTGRRAPDSPTTSEAPVVVGVDKVDRRRAVLKLPLTDDLTSESGSAYALRQVYTSHPLFHACFCAIT